MKYSSSAWSRLVARETVTGSRSMMSGTVTPARRSATADCLTAPRPAWPRIRGRRTPSRPGPGAPRLAPRGPALAVHARDPPEEPQVDARDLDALAARGEGMAQLVEDQRGEEGQRRADRHRVGGGVRVEHLAKQAREP